MHNDIERQNFWSVETLHINKNFSSDLWLKINEGLKISEERGLLITYENLLEERKHPIHCNNFLEYVSQYKLTSDLIAHIIHPLSTIKEKLSNWDSFIEYARNQMRKEMSAAEVEFLLNVLS